MQRKYKAKVMTNFEVAAPNLPRCESIKPSSFIGIVQVQLVALHLAPTRLRPRGIEIPAKDRPNGVGFPSVTEAAVRGLGKAAGRQRNREDSSLTRRRRPRRWARRFRRSALTSLTPGQPAPSYPSRSSSLRKPQVVSVQLGQSDYRVFKP